MGLLRRYFIAGLLVWLPLGVTVLVVRFLVTSMDQTLLLLPAAWRPEQALGVTIPGLGALLLVVLIFATGVVVANLFGRQVVRVWEALLARIPLVRAVYSATKQLTETIFSGSGKSFRKVVLVEFPRRDCWTLAFVTGEGLAEAETRTGRDMINVFVPTTPNPTGGYFLVVPRSDVIEIDMPVDVGLKIILSAGAVSAGPGGGVAPAARTPGAAVSLAPPAVQSADLIP